MIFNINYILCIIYSFSILFVLYICLQIYKNYSFYLFEQDNKIISSEKIFTKKIKSNNLTLIKNLKKQFKIKSTEKTFEDIKFISNKPNYININELNELNELNEYDKLNIISNIKKIQNYNNDKTLQKITRTYLYTKQKYFNTFINAQNDKYFINDLNDLCIFYKLKYDQTNVFDGNILIKFYNSTEYVYMYVLKNKMIKIVYNDDYNDLTMLIEKNNGIFVLIDKINNYFIGYGNYTQNEINLDIIKNIFFPNTKNHERDKNYLLFSKFKFAKIYFYVCTKI